MHNKIIKTPLIVKTAQAVNVFKGVNLITSANHLKLSSDYLYKKPDYPNPSFLELSYYCTRNCMGCYVPDRADETTILEKTIAERFIKELSSIGTKYFVFIGGEPLEEQTRDMVIELAAANRGKIFNVCTNGFHIDEEFIRRTSKMHNFSLALSIDGFKAENDYRRGNGAFEAFTRATTLLREARMLFITYTTINKKNHEEVSSRDFISFLLNSGSKIAHFQRHFGEVPSLILDDDNYVQTLKRLMHLARTSSLLLNSSSYGRLDKPSLGNRYRPILLSHKGFIKTSRTGVELADLRTTSITEIMSSAAYKEEMARYGTNVDERGDHADILSRLLSD